MTTLAAQFQTLVNAGQISPATDAPRIEPFYEPRQVGMRTVYDLGEVMIRGWARDAELDTNSGRNPDTRR